jgi:hypothetical protein
MIKLTQVVLKSLLKQVGIVYQVIQGFFIYLISRKPNVLILKPIKNAKKIAIFAAYRKHYDASVDLTLGELKKRGFSIVFISNCGLSKDFIRQLKNKVDIVIQRGNYGRCIAAYKTAYLFLHANKFHGADHILFLNDTMIFPLCNTDIFWKDLDRCQEKIAGIFESNEIRPHLQTYFIYCKDKVFLNPSFYNFWVKYIPFNSKQLIIKYGELGFSKMLNDSFLKTYAFVNRSKLGHLITRKRKWIDDNYISHSWLKNLGIYVSGLDLKTNPSHFFALLALRFLHVPMLKTDLLSSKSFSQSELLEFLKNYKSSVSHDFILSELNVKFKNKEAFLYQLKSYMGMI